MSIYSKRQSQFELFPQRDQKLIEEEKSPCIFKNLTLSPENIIVICIILIVTFVLSFSWGVENGRKLTQVSDQVSPISQEMVEKTHGFAEHSTASIETGGQVIPQPKEVREKREVLEVPEKKKEFLGRNYTIQVASFKLEKNARKEAQGLEKLGYDIHVMPKGSYSIVCVGQFENKDQAKDFSAKIKNKYKDYLIRRL